MDPKETIVKYDLQLIKKNCVDVHTAFAAFD